MLNEMRGQAAVMVLAGLTIMAGTVLTGLRPTSFAVGAVVFGGFALGRVISAVLDGKPNKDLVTGTISEVVFGTLHVVCLAMTLS